MHNALLNKADRAHLELKESKACKTDDNNASTYPGPGSES